MKAEKFDPRKLLNKIKNLSKENSDILLKILFKSFPGQPTLEFLSGFVNHVILKILEEKLGTRGG